MKVKLEQKESQVQQKQTSLNLQREAVAAALREVEEEHNSITSERTQAVKAEDQVIQQASIINSNKFNCQHHAFPSTESLLLR